MTNTNMLQMLSLLEATERNCRTMWGIIDYHDIELHEEDCDGYETCDCKRVKAINDVFVAFKKLKSFVNDELHSKQHPFINRCSRCGCSIDRHDSHGRDDEAHECFDCECLEYEASGYEQEEK